MTVIYLLDAVGLLAGPVDLPVIPGLGRQLPGNAIELPDALPDPEDGYAWVMVDGQPLLLADRRGTVYRTDSGEAVQHDELGDLPDCLTTEPRPTPAHIWRDGLWQHDDALAAEIAQRQTAEAVTAVERQRLLAYADPLTGSDRLYIEYQRELSLGNTDTAETARLAWLERGDQIRAQYPWPVG